MRRGGYRVLYDRPESTVLKDANPAQGIYEVIYVVILRWHRKAPKNDASSHQNSELDREQSPQSDRCKPGALRQGPSYFPQPESPCVQRSYADIAQRPPKDQAGLPASLSPTIRRRPHRPSESGRNGQEGLQSLRRMNPIDARRIRTAAFLVGLSKSFASRRRPTEACFRSATHRLGRTSKPLA